MSAIKSTASKVLRRSLRSLPVKAQASLGRGGAWLTNECTSVQPITAVELHPYLPLPLPAGADEAQLRKVFSTWSIDGEPEGHMDAYVDDSFGRFVRTYGLVSNLSGTCLELGANPYFATHLIEEYTDLKVSYANYFGGTDAEASQVLRYRTVDDTEVTQDLHSLLFNIEDDEIPYREGEFDVVLFCEIIEHLLMDPVAVLRKIRRVLKPGGTLILTTPNVARLSNILRLANGQNVYDPYSGYGPYGRHNREYLMSELHALLAFMGFTIDESFTADSHRDDYQSMPRFAELAPLLLGRGPELGQYHFLRARMTGEARDGLPDLLYRSWPAGAIVPTA